jgi:peptide/nickel transport system substrate-binding protein
MVQALIQGEIDYARGMTYTQFNQLKNEPDIVTVNGKSNGWTELGFNTYGTGTGKTIEGGGPSTKALLDPAFRDALGFAIDKQELLDQIIGGYGDIGSTQVPPVLADWHVEPTDLRTFDIALAGQKLDAAGYAVDGSGRRLDMEGKPISLRLVVPDSDAEFLDIAEYIKDWFGELGVAVTAEAYDEGTLVDLMLPPEGGEPTYKANYDLFIWSWSGSPDPAPLLDIFTCDAIGSSSDSLWCNEQYDADYEAQNHSSSVEERKQLMTEMQQLFYDQAPYHILYYDDELHAYRTDRFAGWTNIPENGTPLLTYGTYGYTLLTEAGAAPSPSAGTPSPGASAGPTQAPNTPAPGSTTGAGALPIIALVVVLIVAAFGLFAMSRRRRAAADEEDE